ncbi:MAG: AsmA family protein [Bacteroidaceae bacterium]|nr:AsmA family protein [Bacteroidaceae bacterium]
MKKLLKVVVTIIVAIMLVLVAVPYLFKDKIEEIIKQEGNKMLNAEFDFGNLGISLFRNFPLASLTLEDFYLKGVGQFGSDTLVAANEVTAAVNVMSLFGDEGFDIKNVLLDGVSVKAIVMPDSSVNWDVMKMAEESAEEVETDTTAAFRIKLQELTVNNLNVVYDDRLAGMYANIANLNAKCSGDFGSARTLVQLAASIGALTFSMDGVPFLNKAHISLNTNVDADLENSKFTIKENTFQLNEIKTAIDGWVALTQNGVDMDISMASNEIGFKDVLSLVPAIYSKDFEGLKTDGVASIKAFAMGSLVGDSVVPEFGVDLRVRDAMFQYPMLPAGVNDINVGVCVTNPGGSLDNTVVEVGKFAFVMAGNPFNVTATLKTPISDMQFNVAAKGKLDLGKIKDIYPLEEMALNGVVDADMSVSGKMSNIDKGDYDKVKASGSVRLNGMTLAMKDMPNIDIKNSVLTFTPRYLQLSETTVNIGENDITLDSKFENYMGFALKGTTLKGSLNVKSNKLNLNDFMTTDSSAVATAETQTAAADTAAMGVIRVPENIDFAMNVNFAQVLFGKMAFNKLNGKLIVNNGKVDMKNLSLNTMGGEIVVNGFYNAPADVQPEFNASLKMSDIVFAQAYKELDMVQKLAPIFGGITGSFSGNMSINTKLDDTMSPVVQTMTGSGSLSTKEVSMDSVKVIQMVADILQKPSLKNTRVKDMKVEFTVSNGRVHTKPFDIKLGEYKMNLSGSTGLDQTIDYTGKIEIPQSMGKVAKLGTVDMSIGGTFTSPKVSIDLESMARNAAKNAAEDAVSKLLGIDKDSSESGDSTATSGSGKKDAVKNALDKAKNLFKK